MSLISLKRSFPLHVFPKARCLSTPAAHEEGEYTATPQYPPILDLSYAKRMERIKEAKHNEIRSVKTVEEKQIKINMPKYYGFKSHMLVEDRLPYDSLSLAQYLTRTHLIKNKDLPEYYQNIKVENIETISKGVQEALLMEIDSIQKLHDIKNDELTDTQRENFIGHNIIWNINRVLNNNLASQYPHIINSEMDVDPIIESSWVVGSINPPKQIKSARKGHEFCKQFENDPVDRTICYRASPNLTIRAELPLPCVLAPSEAENPALEVPVFQYDPRVVGVACDHRRATNIPGFWPGDSHTFGLIGFFKTGHLLERAQRIQDERDIKDAYISQAILGSYAWLHSQANHLGFTTYNDLTYPLVTQTVLTNGKDFKFYIYQLNTILLHTKNATENPKRNVCWASEDLKLYEEIKDGKIVGFNEDILTLLVKLYGNIPAERLGVNLRPYLSQDEKLAADYEDDDKRKWLERQYKEIVSNRPSHWEFPEIFAWEKIYKIDHETRFTDKRRRFFEFFQRPSKRPMNERRPRYIPRALRPDLPRHKGRFGKDYWP